MNLSRDLATGQANAPLARRRDECQLRALGYDSNVIESKDIGIFIFSDPRR